MSKIIGYIISILGLAVIGLGSMIKSRIPVLANSPKAMLYIILAGIILIVLGIAFVLGFSSSGSNTIKQAAEEVPIYQGEGKNRKIVGYKQEVKK